MSHRRGFYGYGLPYADISELSGKLIVVNPSYSHSFGTTVPELLTIGTEAEE